MSIEVLQSKTMAELRDMAKELGIAGRWDMTKGKLIEAIRQTESNTTDVAEETKEAKVEDAVEEEDWDESSGETADDESDDRVRREYIINGEKKTVTTVSSDVKVKYVQDAEVGTIVAFELLDGSVRSAMIENKSTKRHMLKLVNKAGEEFIVPYSSVLWVRSGKKWPKLIFELLTGGKKNGRKPCKANSR